MSSDDTEEALFFALLLREASVFVVLFVFFFFFRLFFFPCISCAFACEPTKQQRENENTEETRFSASFCSSFKAVSPKRSAFFVYRSNAPPSLFNSSVGRFFFLKPLKKAPSSCYGKSGESCVPLRKKTNERKNSSFLIAKQQQQQQQHHATEEEDDKDDEGTNTTTSGNEETQNAIEDASS